MKKSTIFALAAIAFATLPAHAKTKLAAESGSAIASRLGNNADAYKATARNDSYAEGREGRLVETGSNSEITEDGWRRNVRGAQIAGGRASGRTSRR